VGHGLSSNAIKQLDWRRLPDFIAVGPPRTGTTWLDNVLRGNAGLPSRIKETHFFIWRYSKGLDWYARHFQDCPPSVPAGEVAPTYFASPEARERMARDLPGCRIICTLRDPAERLYSHYRMWCKLGLIAEPFADASINHRLMLEHNRYAAHVKAWRQAFGENNTLVLLHDDLDADPQGYLDRFCAFTGIPRIDLKPSPIGSKRVNRVERAPRSHRLAYRAHRIRARLREHGMYRVGGLLEPLFQQCFGGGQSFPPLDPDFEAHLKSRFRPEIEELEIILDRDLSSWKEPRRRDAETAASAHRQAS